MHDMSRSAPASPDETACDAPSPAPEELPAGNERDPRIEGNDARPVATPCPPRSRRSARTLGKAAAKAAIVPSVALLWLVPAAHADTLLDNEPEVVPLIVDAPDQAEVPVERDAETGLSSPTHTAATPLTAPDLLPNSAVPENFEIVDYRTMDPSQLLRVRAYDLGGTRIGTLDSWWPADAETFEGIEAAVIGEGGLFGLFDTDIAVPLDRIAVLAEMGGNGLRVVVAAPAEEMDAFPEVDG